MNSVQVQTFLQGCDVKVIDFYDALTKHYTWRDKDGEVKAQAIINHTLFLFKVYPRNRQPVKFFGEEAKVLAESFGALPMHRTMLNRSQIHTCRQLILETSDGDVEIATTLANFHRKTSFRALLKKSLN